MIKLLRAAAAKLLPFLSGGQSVFAIVAVVAIVSAIGLTYLMGRDDGSDATINRIERHNDRAEEVIREHRETRQDCRNAGGSWNVSTGTCD